MTSLKAWITVMLALATSSSALAQPAEPGLPRPPRAPATEPSPLDLPPGYSDPVPETRTEWEHARKSMKARVEGAERRLETVRELGDPSEEERVEVELDVRKDALERFEERTMSRNPGAAAAGGTLMAIGFVGILLAMMNEVIIGPPEHDPPSMHSRSGSAAPCSSGPASRCLS